MAEVMRYVAKVTVQDSAGKFATVPVRVDATDAKAWFAAADTAARAATKVGLLQLAIFSLMLSSQQFSYAVEGEAVNDAHVKPSLESNAFNSNKLNIHYTTTLGGLPEKGFFTIPQREPSSFEMESDGVTVVLDDADEVANLVVQLLDTGLSKYGTAITAVDKIDLNDQ